MMTRPSAPNPILKTEFRGVWVATVANIDWPSAPGLSTEKQQRELKAIVDTCAASGINAIVFQVRPAADSLYKSELEPWSYFLTGAQGQAPSPEWDPLSYLCATAHKQGIEVHAWINPYRAKHTMQTTGVASNHVSKIRPSKVYEYGGYLWMDPGDPALQAQSLGVVKDIVERYDIDGIHMDDYFYPYPVSSGGQKVPFPDSETYQQYRNDGGSLELSDWRRENVNTFVLRLHRIIRITKPWVKLGISPFGIYRPGVPQGISAGVDQYEDLGADALKWWREGTLDYLSPQLYWPIEQTPQSFPVLLKWWKAQNAQGKHLWPGLFTSRLNPSDGNWALSQLERQVGLIRSELGADSGHIHFSYKALAKNWKNVQVAARTRMYSSKAAVPATTWADSTHPPTPTLTYRRGRVVVTNAPKDIRFVAFYVSQGSGWRQVQYSDTTFAYIPTVARDSEIAAIMVDRSGDQSEVGRISVD